MNALALRPAQLPSPCTGSGTAMLTAAGGVSAFFSLEAFDARLGLAIYALRVINYTTAALVCRVWTISRKGDATLAYPVLVEVLPGSTLQTEIPVLPAAVPPFQRAIAEIAGQGVHCLVEAPSPTIPKRRNGYALASAAAAAGLLMIVGGLGIRAALPRIDALALPPQTLPGTTVRAEYDASGAGTLKYWVLAPDGSTFAGGTLSERAGSIPIAVPASAQGAYTLQVAMSGPLGRASETRVLNTLSIGKRREGATVNDISVHPIAAKPGEIVNVSYAAAADDGYLRLVGSDGTIWSQQPFSHGGQTRFVVPPVAAGDQLQVLLHVTKGTSSAESVAGLIVAGSASQTSSEKATPQVVSNDDPNVVPATSNDDSNGTFDVIVKTVKSGGTIAVKIFSPRNGMRLSLMDTQSHEVSAVDVGSDAETVTLRAPVVYQPTKYIVVASFTDGFGQETVVQPVTVTP